MEELIDAGGTARIDVIVLLAEAASNDQEEAIVGIGPVESLIYTHGDAAVTLLTETPTDARIRSATRACLVAIRGRVARVLPGRSPGTAARASEP